MRVKLIQVLRQHAQLLLAIVRNICGCTCGDIQQFEELAREVEQNHI